MKAILTLEVDVPDTAGCALLLALVDTLKAALPDRIPFCGATVESGTVDRTVWLDISS